MQRILLAIPEDVAILAMVAIGKLGNREALSSELQSREEPGTRRPANESVSHGRFRV